MRIVSAGSVTPVSWIGRIQTPMTQGRLSDLYRMVRPAPPRTFRRGIFR